MNGGRHLTRIVESCASCPCLRKGTPGSGVHKTVMKEEEHVSCTSCGDFFLPPEHQSLCRHVPVGLGIRGTHPMYIKPSETPLGVTPRNRILCPIELKSVCYRPSKTTKSQRGVSGLPKSLGVSSSLPLTFSQM